MRLLLVGGGHASVAVLRAAGRWTRQGARVTLVNDRPTLLYSGMTPEWLGGHYRSEEVCIDLLHWCRKNGVRFVASPATGVDAAQRVVHTAEGSALPCDLAVFNLGATNPLQDRAGDAVPTKPLHHIGRLKTWLEEALKHPRPQSSLVVVGGGPAGTEVMLNVSACLGRSPSRAAPRLTLIHSGERLMPQFGAGMGRRAERFLRERGVDVRLSSKVARVEADAVVLTSGERLKQDLVLWATGTTGPPIFREAGLPVSEGGYLRVQRDLRCVGLPWLLAAGDCAQVEGLKLERSGVNAVKEGLTLRHNLDRFVKAFQQGEDLAGVRLSRFRPYPVSPYLVSTGTPEALLALGARVWLRGRALLWLKHGVDRLWIGRYQYQ